MEGIDRAHGREKNRTMTVICASFGHKYGDVTDAELVFDVRCFSNPYYVPELRDGTGLDADVSAYVFSHEDARAFMDKLYALLGFLLPLYEKEGRRKITVAFGCTGGQHRSVSVANYLYEHYKEQILCFCRHREMNV